MLCERVFIEKKLNFLVDECEKLRYNAILQGYISERGVFYVENISA